MEKEINQFSRSASATGHLTPEAQPPAAHPEWQFRFVSAGCPIFYDPPNALYHSVIPLEETASLYQGQFYEQGSAARFVSPIEVGTRWFRRWRAAYLARYVRPSGGVLDIGCGNAYVLYYLREKHQVPVVVGTQVSETAQAFARDVLGVTVKLGELPALMAELPKFSVVTAWHVFEHVADYETYFRLSWELLTPNGHLILEVPNARSWTIPLSREGWMGWDPPQHVVHFTPEGLRKLLVRYGFEVVRQSTFSLEYSTFTSLQSICNRFSKTRNAFYDGLRRVGGSQPSWGLVIWQGFLFVLLFFPVLLVNVLLSPTPWGEVIHVVAKKQVAGDR